MTSRPSGRCLEQPYISYQTSTSTPVKPQPIEHTVTSIATQRTLLSANHSSSSPNPVTFAVTNNLPIFQTNNKYIEKDNYQIENKSKLSLPPETERIRIKSPEKSLSNDKLCEKNGARLRLSQEEGLYERRDHRVQQNERLCLSSERLNHHHHQNFGGDGREDRKYHSIFLNETTPKSFIDSDLIDSKEKSSSSSNFKNDHVRERSFRSQENLNFKHHQQQQQQSKSKNSPTFQEQKEKFLQEIKDKTNGTINETKHFKNVKNDSDKCQKSPILRDIKDKKTGSVLPKRNVNNFAGGKNIPENFSPGPQLVPERDLNNSGLPPHQSLIGDVDFFVSSQCGGSSGNFNGKIDGGGNSVVDVKREEYFNTSTDSVNELNDDRTEDGSFQQDLNSSHRTSNDVMCNGRLDAKLESQNRCRVESQHENNYENVEVQSPPKSSQNYENEVREKMLYLKKDSSKREDESYNVVSSKDSAVDLVKPDESVILVPSDFENTNQKNLIVKPLSTNVGRTLSSNGGARHSSKNSSKNYSAARTTGGGGGGGGSSPDKSSVVYCEGNFQGKQSEGNPLIKDGGGKQLVGAMASSNKSGGGGGGGSGGGVGPQVNKQLKSICGSKVVSSSSRQGNGMSSSATSSSGSRGQRLPHRHVSEQELLLLQVSRRTNFFLVFLKINFDDYNVKT